jgi:TolB-like protein
MKIVTIGDDSYMILGEVSVETEYTGEQLKSQYCLADTILRNNNKFYICMKIIDAEFYDI